mmetsp:Transcript_35508/g.102106  ORF Transcript_35508/g.102106 Transcript_35508/m.102106 type:complete len:206 (-) Transcript_35508:34-651(-)
MSAKVSAEGGRPWGSGLATSRGKTRRPWSTASVKLALSRSPGMYTAARFMSWAKSGACRTQGGSAKSGGGGGCRCCCCCCRRRSAAAWASSSWREGPPRPSSARCSYSGSSATSPPASFGRNSSGPSDSSSSSRSWSSPKEGGGKSRVGGSSRCSPSSSSRKGASPPRGPKPCASGASRGLGASQAAHSNAEGALMSVQWGHSQC